MDPLCNYILGLALSAGSGLSPRQITVCRADVVEHYIRSAGKDLDSQTHCQDYPPLACTSSGLKFTLRSPKMPQHARHLTQLLTVCGIMWSCLTFVLRGVLVSWRSVAANQYWWLMECMSLLADKTRLMRLGHTVTLTFSVLPFINLSRALRGILCDFPGKSVCHYLSFCTVTVSERYLSPALADWHRG